MHKHGRLREKTINFVSHIEICKTKNEIMKKLTFNKTLQN